MLRKNSQMQAAGLLERSLKQLDNVDLGVPRGTFKGGNIRAI